MSSNYNWIDKLSEATRLALQKHMTLETFESGRFLFQAGQEANAFYRVVSGHVKMTSISTTGKETLYGLWERGDIFGELGLIDQYPRLHNAQAHGKVEVAKLKRADFQALREKYPDINEQLFLFLCHKLRVLSETFEDTNLLDLTHRLAQRVYEMAADTGKPSRDGLRVDSGLSQTELGNMVGASRQSVGKVLNSWQKRRIIDIHYGGLTIRRLDLLRELAEN